MTVPRSLRRAPAAIAVAMLGVLGPGVLGAAGPALAQDDTSADVSFTVTGVDGTDLSEVTVTVLGLTDPPAAADVALVEAGEDRAVSGVTPSTEAGIPAEVVFVVDTNARAAEGEVLEEVKQQLHTAVEGFPSTTSVGVVSAGSTALVLQKPTTDRAAADAAIDALSAKNGSSLHNALDRAGELFSDGPGTVRSVVLFATGTDTGSATTVAEAQVGLVQAGAQLITVDYGGGEPGFASVVETTRGVGLSASSAAEVGPAVERAAELASERTLISFAGTTELGRRGNLTITIGDTTRELAYPAGSVTSTVLQLAPQPVADPPGLALFRSSLGLYLALGLAFVGISLGIWSLGSIMAGGESSLEGMLARYAEGEAGDEADVEDLIVQSALLQRAVTLSESFAEKRGFLARVEEMLERANLPVRAGEAMFMLVAVVLLSGALIGALSRSLLAALIVALGTGGLAFFVIRLLARRRFKKFESLLPDTLQLLSGTLRAGYSLPQGLEVVSKEISDPMGQELRRAMTEARLGRDLEDCLGGVSERMASGDFAWAVMAISIQREVGGNLNELLLSVADTMIARERLKREIGALTAEGKMSAAVLSFLPPGLGLVMWVMNPEYINLLFTETMGNVLLGLGMVSALIGLAWMKKVITVDV